MNVYDMFMTRLVYMSVCLFVSYVVLFFVSDVFFIDH